MQKSSLHQSVNILLFIVLSAAILYTARSFLIPFTLAGLLAMVFLSFCRWLELKKVNRAIASLICVISFAGIVAGIFILLGWQLADISEDSSKLQQNVTRQLHKLQQYISSTLGISPEEQQEMLKQQTSNANAGATKAIPGIMSFLLGFAADTVLMIVYMFLFLYLRRHLKNFILKLQKTSTGKEKAKVILEKTSKVTQQYLFGLGAMIAILWVMYGIGFSVVGVKYAIFFAILCGLLEIVPFVGNLTGTAITLLMAITQGGSGWMIAGVLITYFVVQFIQSYILEPLIVGAQVNINPLITIAALIIGELIWGIAGMVIAIPLAGVVKIVCTHIEPLHPYAYLLGNDKEEEKSASVRQQ